MEKIIVKSCDIEIETFHQYKKPILIKNVDINKIVASNKVSFGKKGFKFFIGYKDVKNKPLCIFLPKTSTF